MAIANTEITWGELISAAEANLQNIIENLSGATIPNELNGTTIIVGQVRSAKTTATSDRRWTTVSWETVRNDFHSFLESKDLDSTQRQDQLVSTRLILNFFENLSLFYTNRLVIVYSPIGNKPKKLYYYNDGSGYDTWQGRINNIESPVIDYPAGATEINDILQSVNNNLKNKTKTYTQSYTFVTTCSCCSSSSSSSSCWTIIHQDLSLL